MTEEQIHYKARLYAVGRARAAFPTICNSPDSLILMTCGFSADNIATAFEDGVRYADDNLWHKTEDEKPDDGQRVLVIYNEKLNLHWLKYNHSEEENDGCWCDSDGNELIPPKYWMALPKSPLGDDFGEEIW